MRRLTLFLFISLLAITYVASVAAPRSFMWIVGDPHIYSPQKGYEICKIGTTAQNCLLTNNSKVSISCKGAVVDSTNANATLAAATYLSSITITFNNGESIVSYTANAPASPLAPGLDSTGKTNVSNTAGALWLKVVFGGSATTTSGATFSTVTIYDYNSTTLIGITQFSKTDNSRTDSYYTLTVGTLNSQLDANSGIMYTGCPSSLLVTGRRRKRSITGCSSIVSTDATLTTALAQYICDFDGSVTLNTVEGNALGITAVASYRSLDTTFSDASSFKLMNNAARFGIIVIALFNILFNQL